MWNRALVSLLALVLCLLVLWTDLAWLHWIALVALGLVLAMVLVDRLDTWLPALVAKQRWRYKLMPLHTRGTVLVPNEAIQGKDVARLFGHEDVSQRSLSGFRALTRFWHAPCSHYHQEIMEKNDLYDQIAPITTRLLSTSSSTVRALTRAHVEEALQREQARRPRWSIVGIRSIGVPIVMEICHELVFAKRCPPQSLGLFRASLADVTKSTAANSRGNMEVRELLTRHLSDMIEQEQGLPAVFGASCALSVQERAKYLQGVWFHTAPLQIGRLACNTVACLSRDERSLARMRQGEEVARSFVEQALLETLRLFPGVSITTHGATKDVAIGPNHSIQNGMSVLFDIGAFHRMDFEEPDTFCPERWDTLSRKDANYIPFGSGRRRCPAERFSFVIASEIVLGMLSAFDFYFPKANLAAPGRSRFSHDLCCVVRRGKLSHIGMWMIVHWLRWLEAFTVIKKCVIHLALWPGNMQTAFGAVAAERDGS